MEEVEVIVVPETPKYLGGQELYVYLPLATNETKGIASFSQQFKIVNGQVQLLIDESYFLGVQNYFTVQSVNTLTDASGTIVQFTFGKEGADNPVLRPNTEIIVSCEYFIENEFTYEDRLQFVYTDKNGTTKTYNLYTPETYFRLENTRILKFKEFRKYIYCDYSGPLANNAIMFLCKITILNDTKAIISDFNADYVDELMFLTTQQKNALNSGANTTKINQIATNTNDINNLKTRTTNIENRLPSGTGMLATKQSVDDINELIPEAASASNQLADKEFVNSSIATNTSNFIGTFGGEHRWEELNDICYVTAESYISAGSIIKAGSIINNTEYTEDITLETGVTVTVDSTLTPGSFINIGSNLYNGSIFNHIYYEDGYTFLIVGLPVVTSTNNDYAYVVNMEFDFLTIQNMQQYDKSLLTNFDYAWIPNDTKYDLYRFNFENKTWEQKATAINKTDVTLNTAYNRYKYRQLYKFWSYEYTLNNSSFTAVQWQAINSGVTAETVNQVGINTANITLKANQSDLVSLANIVDSKPNMSGVYTVTILITDWDISTNSCTIDLTDYGVTETRTNFKIQTFVPMLSDKASTNSNKMLLADAGISYVDVQTGTANDEFYANAILYCDQIPVDTIYIGLEVFE